MQHFQQVLIADGSTLEALFRNTDYHSALGGGASGSLLSALAIEDAFKLVKRFPPSLPTGQGE